MAAIRHLGILISPYKTTHLSLSNFVLIRYIIVLKIWGFDVLQNWLEMPIYAPKIPFMALKIIDHRRDPQKAHLHLKPRAMSINSFNSVHICNL